jgi:hypothetical protein
VYSRLGGTKEALYEHRIIFFLWTKMEIIKSGQHFCTVYQRIVAAVKRIEFVSDKVSYTVLRCRWCDTITLNAHKKT